MKNNVTNRFVARNSIFRLLSFLITVITTVLYVRFVVKYLGIDVYGIWGLASLIISSSNIINFGFATALTKETAKIDGEGTNYWLVKTLIRGYDYLIIGIGLLLLLVIYIFRNPIAQHIFGVRDTYIQGFSYLLTAMVPLTILYTVALSRRSVVEGFQEIHYSSIITLIGRLVNFSLSLSLIFVGLGIWSLYFASLAENLMLFWIFSQRIHKKLKSLPCYQDTKLDLKEAMIKNLIYSFNLQVSAIASISLEFFYKIFISHRFGLDYVGYFQIVWRAQQMLHGVVSSTMSPLFPASSFYMAKGDTLQLKKLYEKSTKYIWLFVAGVFLIFILFADEILRLWISQTSDFQIFTFRMLCTGVIFTALSTPAFLFIIGMGKSIFIGAANTLFLIVSLLTSLILSSIFSLSWMSVGISFTLGAVASFTVILVGFAETFKWHVIKLTISSLPSLRFIFPLFFLLILVVIYKSILSISGIIPEYIALLVTFIVFLSALLVEVFGEVRNFMNSKFIEKRAEKVKAEHEVVK